MTSSAVLRRRSRAGATLALAVGALLALAGLAVGTGATPGTGATTVPGAHGEHAPFSFD
jgi:hypothetical protein